MANENLISIKVWDQDQMIELSVPQGVKLRTALLENGLSPYGPYTQKANCRGNGICATCGILPMEGVPKAAHWHDKLAAQFGYPRLSCQIRIDAPMSVRLITDKGIWE